MDYRKTLEKFVREGTYPTEEERDAIREVLAEVARLRAENERGQLWRKRDEGLKAEVERLEAQIKLLEGYVGNEMYRSDFQTAGHMRAEVERLKAFEADCEAALEILNGALDKEPAWMVGSSENVTVAVARAAVKALTGGRRK